MDGSAGIGRIQELSSLLKEVARECNLAALYHGACELDEAVRASKRPFEMAFFGRMKTGKSSLINACIGQSLAIMGGEEATATINKLRYGEEEQRKTFTIHWRDQIPAEETFPLENLQSDWSGKSQQVLERIGRTAYLELYASAPVLRKVHIIDTPGTGSTATEHEDMARQFISGQETDALVYVFSSVVRETDEKALATFRKSCVPDSTPYNSVAVLHKWDDIYWSNGGQWHDIESKANFLRGHMSHVVAEVVAVSAPLALLARTAPLRFWQDALQLCATFDDELDLTDLLNDQQDMAEHSACAALYGAAQEWNLPLASFRVMLRHIYRERSATAEEVRDSIERFSGIQRLEELVERRFFRRATLLQHRKLWAKVSQTLKEVMEAMEQHRLQLETEIRHLDFQLSVMSTRYGAEHEECKYLDERRGMLELARRKVDARHDQSDRIRIQLGKELEFNGLSLELLPWLDEHPEAFPEAETALLRRLLGSSVATARCDESERSKLNSLRQRSVAFRNAPERVTRELASKLYRAVVNIHRLSYGNNA